MGPVFKQPWLLVCCVLDSIIHHKTYVCVLRITSQNNGMAEEKCEFSVWVLQEAKQKRSESREGKLLECLKAECFLKWDYFVIEFSNIKTASGNWYLTKRGTGSRNSEAAMHVRKSGISALYPLLYLMYHWPFFFFFYWIIKSSFALTRHYTQTHTD